MTSTSEAKWIPLQVNASSIATYEQLLPFNSVIPNGSELRFILPATLDMIKSPRMNITIQYDFRNIPNTGMADFLMAPDPVLGAYDFFTTHQLRNRKADVLDSCPNPLPFVMDQIARKNPKEYNQIQHDLGNQVLDFDSICQPSQARESGLWAKEAFTTVTSPGAGWLRFYKVFTLTPPFCLPDNWWMFAWGQLTYSCTFAINPATQLGPRRRKFNGYLNTVQDCLLGNNTGGVANGPIRLAALTCPRTFSGVATGDSNFPGYGEFITLVIDRVPLGTKDLYDVIGSASQQTALQTALINAGLLTVDPATGARGGQYANWKYPNTNFMTSGFELLIRLAGTDGAFSDHFNTNQGPNLNVPQGVGRPMLDHKYVHVFVPPGSIGSIQLLPRQGAASTGLNSYGIDALGETGVVQLVLTTPITVQIPLLQTQHVMTAVSAAPNQPTCDDASALTIATTGNSTDFPIAGGGYAALDYTFEYWVIEGAPIPGSNVLPMTQPQGTWTFMTPTTVSISDLAFEYNRIKVPPSVKESVIEQLKSDDGFSVTFPQYYNAAMPQNTFLQSAQSFTVPFTEPYGMRFYITAPGYAGSLGCWKSTHLAPWTQGRILVNNEVRNQFFPPSLAASMGGDYPYQLPCTNNNAAALANPTTIGNYFTQFYKGYGHAGRVDVLLARYYTNSQPLDTGATVTSSINLTAFATHPWYCLPFPMSVENGYVSQYRGAQIQVEFSLQSIHEPRCWMTGPSTQVGYQLTNAVIFQTPPGIVVDSSQAIAGIFNVEYSYREKLVWTLRDAGSGMEGETRLIVRK